MNRGNVLQSSPVHQMLAGGPNNWWSMIATTRPSQPPTSTHLPAVAPTGQPHFFPHQHAPQPPLSSPSLWHDNQSFPDSLSQLLMSGSAGEDDKPSTLTHMQQVKKLENWEEQLLHDHQLHQHHHHHHHNSSIVNSMVSSIKQENSLPYGPSYGHGNIDYHGAKQNNWSNQMIPVSSPTSCITSMSNNMLDFSTTISNKTDGRHPPPDRSSECNSTATGGASKKAKIQPSANQSTFKVRKEKLGDRITALHQLVSPFGKTDTASVLLEAIGYIRFLQNQIEALSLPYLGSGSGNMRNQRSVQQGERNCLFPEDPGQLLNDSCMKMKGSALEQDSHKEPKKDLRSRGLCLVPVSCTMQVGSDNGADYWAPALNGGFR